MKTLKVKFLLVSLVLLICSIGLAQDKSSDRTQALREQLRQLEAVDVEGKSALIQNLHQRTLRSSRRQLAAAIDDDLNALRTMQAAVGSSDSETRNEIDAQIKTLTQERSELAARIEGPGGNSSASMSAGDGTRSSGASSDASGPLISSPRFVGAAPPVTASPRPAAPSPATSEAAEVATARPTPQIDVRSCKLTNNYQDAPPLLVQRIEQAAAAIQQATDADLADRVANVGSAYPQMMVYTVADAVVPEEARSGSVENIRTIDRLQYLGETARTDKQLGSSTRSAGSTSAIEKPGFARLLGFAIENGGILQNVNNSTLTLSTSPYLLYTMNGGGDSVENYNKAGFLNRIGISASFAMTDTANPLANARRGDLTEWGVKTRLFGDRSTRSKQFQEVWNRDIRPFVEEKGRVLGRPADYIDKSEVLLGLSNNTEAQLRAALIQLLNDPDYTRAGAPQKQMLQNVMLCFMKALVYDPIRSNSVDIGPAARMKFNDEFVPRIATAFANMAQAKKLLTKSLDELAKSPLATFAYTNHRQPTASDYSEFKFLYEQDKTVFGLFKIVGNAGLTMYNKPNPLLNQSRIRDFAAALSFEGAVDSPFLKNQPDMSKITYAFTGNYERLKENAGMPGRKPDLAAFQFKLDIPIYGGMALPFAITYASGTETNKKEHTRFNFGFKFDMDKLLALTKLVGKP